MIKVRKFITIAFLMLVIQGFGYLANAQECLYSDYILDVESTYNNKDKNITVNITNPTPLINEGNPLNLTSLKISIYDGDALIKEENMNNVNFAPGEKKSYIINNLPANFGTNIVTIVATGQISSSYSLGIGSLINVGLNLPSGVVCGDDVLTN